MIARRHYEDTGHVPLTAFRRRSDDLPATDGLLCGAASSSNVAVDVDGEVYACPFLAESSQRFANTRLAATVQPMRLGHIAHPDFWRRLAELPARADETGMFRIGPERRSLHDRCIECPHRAECRACPISVLSEPEHDDVQRIPDYICAFNWTLMSLRKEFPVQPDAAALLEGRAPKPRLVRELLERAGAGG
jgi:radical SAM protein with 4Fe4S-binding SPASM domain